jgi:predicted kinase
MKIVIVSGAPASGKTTVGKKIAHDLGYEFYGKDTIKEALFDSHPKVIRGYLWYEKRAKAVLINDVQSSFSKGRSVVIESDFNKGDKRWLEPLCKGHQVAEVRCTTKGLTRLKRYISRNENGARHKGHHDRRWYPSMFIQALGTYIGLEWPYYPMGLSAVIKVDTSDFSKIDYRAILATLQL